MTTINIDLSSAKPISPMLYGAFFEDINYGADGGLYAELVANRSFEHFDREGKRDLSKQCWEAVGGASFATGTARPLNSAHKVYAIVSGGEMSGIRSTGYSGAGFGVHGGKELILSFYAAADRPVGVTARVMDGDETLAEAGFYVSGGWKKYSAPLAPVRTCAHATLELLLTDGGEARFDIVSLFPRDTYKGRKNGLRRDIAEMIAALHPKFLRFPGGCIVEGRSFKNMYRWKDTVGPIEERKTDFNRWQMEEYQKLGHDASDYFQSFGLGFYEYFQFCEDIGAEPVPVVNCGMTCQWHEGLLTPLEELDRFIEDALDLIEFANGDGKGKWSRIRAAMGHPAPFGLKYLAIGNEQWGDVYFERYELFQKRLSAEHPEIRLITSAGWKDKGWEYDTAYDWMRAHPDGAYAVDEHFYKEPEWFLANTRRYRDYDRRLPKVFIGEWAAHIGAERESPLTERRNNFRAALAEAAFLTGIERDADHVVMSCYAPLLSRVGHGQWQPDLIFFDELTVYGTPSYYVQKLFSEYTGDTSLEAAAGEGLYVSASSRGKEIYVKVVNPTGTDREIDVALPGYMCARTVRISAAPDTENSVQEPVNAAPAELSGTDSRAPGYSVSVLIFTR